MPIPVHIVGGFLGVGKTTALTALVAARAGTERAAVVVNDFGEAGIDAARLGEDGALQPGDVRNIAGGCVCCTAPEGLVRVIGELLDVTRPDRIYIEPSGLARPRDVVDMLARGGLAARVELRPIVVMVDPERFDPADPLLHEQWEAADVLVLNRMDRASAPAVARVRAEAARRWPAFQRVYETAHGVLPADLPDLLRAGPDHDPSHGHDHSHGHEHSHSHDLHADPAADSTAAHVAASRVLGPDVVFAWQALNAVVSRPEIVRFKGMFRTDVGWIRVDRAGGVVDQRGTPYRRDSRYDLIAAAGTDVDALVDAIAAAALAPEAAAGPDIALVDADAHVVSIGVAALSRMGAIDVAARVPGRVGTAVRLADVVALAAPGPDARVVLSAADGMIAEPVRVDALADALLVYALDGGPLPERQGGPFRVLVPSGASACANVKALNRIRVL